MIVPTRGARPTTCAWRSSRSPRRTSAATAYEVLVVDDGPRRATRGVVAACRRAQRRADRLRRARGRARASTPRATPDRGGRVRASSCSSTTTSRRRPAGCARWSRAARRHPEALVLRRPDPAAAGGFAAADVRPRGPADHDARRGSERPRDRARLGSEHGGRPARRSSSPGCSTRASRTASTRTCGSGGCARAAAAIDLHRATPASSTAATRRDARLWPLMRAAYRRGRALRAYIEYRGDAPSRRRASCACWPAASCTSSAAAAATASC